MNIFPLPAPIFILKCLLYLTFFLHAILFSLVLGGSLIIAIYVFKGKEKHLLISKQMASRLPYLMAFTITFGIAPLLFIQSIYPILFYNSALNFSTPFLLVLLNVFISYVLIYIGTKNWEKLKKWKGLIYLLVGVLLSFVMFVYNNIFAFLEEAKDNPLLFRVNRSGFDFYTESPTLLPRFLHFFFASFALGGLWVAIWGTMKLKKEPEQGRWQYRSGATNFASATLLVILSGVWWFFAIPQETTKIVMGKNIILTILFGLLVISSVVSFIFALLGLNSIKPDFFLKVAGYLSAINIFFMIILRDVLRDENLKGVMNFAEMKVRFNGIAFLFFVLFFAVVIFTIYDLYRRIKKETK